jgi:hypothetical protein
MATISRQQIFAQAAKKLRQEFSELSTVPHNALKGQEAEKLVRRFLAEHLPKRFGVGSGFIIDQMNTLSKQSDVVIYDAHNCPVYRASDNASIFPSENVAAVVEVKTRLDKERLAEAFENIGAAKSLAKTAMPDLSLPMPVATQTLGCVFAFESSLTMATLVSHYVEQVKSRGLGRHIDLILILDRGIMTLAARPPGLDWHPALLEGLGGPSAEGSHIGVCASEMGEDSLDAFLRLLLAQLIFFRPMVAHPGFNWMEMQPQPQMLLQYIGSVTHETDPQRRATKLKEYEAAVMADLNSRGVRCGS